MLYRKMPRTGDQLSILGFGCMRLGQRNENNQNHGSVGYTLSFRNLPNEIWIQCLLQE